MPIKTPSNVTKRERWNQLPIIDQLFQPSLRYNRFLYLLIDLLKDLDELSSLLRFPPEIEWESLYP